MSQQYPGGLITKSPPATVGPTDGEGGSAPGVWTLDQAMALKQQSLWPLPPLTKKLYSWGLNYNGQLGQNDAINRSSPVQIGALTTWSQIAAGNSFNLAIKTDGTMWSWGNNNAGQLGHNNIISRSSPVQIGALTTWSKIASGYSFSLAIKTDGALWSWGVNSSGQLGQNNATNRSSPVQVGALTTWSQVAPGNAFSLAIKTDGTMWSWGEGSRGQLGLDDTISRPSPVQIGALTTWSQIASGSDFGVAIKTNGTMWSWGYNNSAGQLGLNNVYDSSSPVQIGALTTWSKIVAGNKFCLAIKTDGTMWSWGQGTTYGALGQNDLINRSSPVQIGALTTWSQIAAGGTFSLAIKTDGALWSWGDGSNGKIGLNNIFSRSSPVQVGALTTWLRLPKMSGSGHSLAISTS